MDTAQHDAAWGGAHPFLPPPSRHGVGPPLRPLHPDRAADAEAVRDAPRRPAAPRTLPPDEGRAGRDVVRLRLPQQPDGEAPRGERANAVRSEMMVLSEKQSQWMWRILVGGVPGSALIVASFVWWRRRRI